MRLFRAIEMWCRKQAAAAVLPVLLAGWLMGPSSQALTTFGKSNTYPPIKDPVPTVSALKCSRQADCRVVPNTSCVRTQYDSITKCLCADNMPPNNGQCQVKTTKALHHTCTVPEDCNDDLICNTLNFTANMPTHLRVFTPSDKVCQCDTVNGYEEHDFACSSADVIAKSISAILLALGMRKFLPY